MKTLVLYYSRTGNTARVAEAIAAELGADLEALQDPTHYAGALGFLKASRDALTGGVAALAPLEHDPAGYDLVIVGQPVWANRPTPAVNALAEMPGFHGRRVALFATYDGSGARGCLLATSRRFTNTRVVSHQSFLRVGRNPAKNLAKAREWARTLAPS